MAWTAPRTYVAGEIITASILNTHIRDNLLEVVQRGGSIPLTANWDAGAFEIRAETFESDVTTGTAPLTIASTTVVTNLNADLVDGQSRALTINADHSHQSTGAQGGKIDHGLALDGLTDDDHTQYPLKTILTTRGDTIRRSATDWERVALGTSGQYLSSNGTDVVWAAGTHVANTIVIWAGTIANIPAGFVICDGNNGTPNLLAKFVEGVATAATNPGTTGGESTHTLTTAELPSHTHNLPGAVAVAGGTTDTIHSGATLTGTTYVQIATASTGSGTAHENRPPFYDVAFIMKT